MSKLMNARNTVAAWPRHHAPHSKCCARLPACLPPVPQADSRVLLQDEAPVCTDTADRTIAL